MYVDNAAMQLVRNPKQFDVIVTGNMFGDILSDEASMLAGSIGMLPSASLDAQQKGLYEPIHGSAPDIAGQDKANPLATILSLAMMFRYSLARADIAERIEHAVRKVLQQGLRTGDIALPGEKIVGTRAMGDAVIAALRSAMMATRRPQISVRRAEVARRRGAVQTTFSSPQAMAGTLQLPLPSVEMWRKRLADCAAEDYMLVAEVEGEVVGNLGLHLGVEVAAAAARRRTSACRCATTGTAAGVGSALHGGRDRHRRQLARLPAARAHRLHRQRRRARAVSQVRLRDRGHAAGVRVPQRRATSTPTRWRGCAPRARHEAEIRRDAREDAAKTAP